MPTPENGPSAPERRDARLKNLRPAWPKGVSGNPAGRPRWEPRVRRYARRYDRRAVDELFRIGTDPKAPYDIRRRALMDLIAVGSGRPALVQEISGRDGAPAGPLVNLNISSGPASATGTDELYRMAMRADANLDEIIAEHERRRALSTHGSAGGVVDGEVVSDRGADENAAQGPPAEATRDRGDAQ